MRQGGEQATSLWMCSVSYCTKHVTVCVNMHVSFMPTLSVLLCTLQPGAYYGGEGGNFGMSQPNWRVVQVIFCFLHS